MCEGGGVWESIAFRQTLSMCMSVCVCGGGGSACSLAMGTICLCRPLQQHHCITSVPEDFATPDNIGSRDQAQ